MQFNPVAQVMATQAQERLYRGARLDGPVEVSIDRTPSRIRTALAGGLRRAARLVGPREPVRSRRSLAA
jgi:hypothetical protein